MGNEPTNTPLGSTHFEAAMLSHKGWVRSNNEDSLAVREFSDKTGLPCLLAVLCDGVGGHLGGEVASRIGVESVIKNVMGSNSLDEPADVLKNAILAANQDLLESYKMKPDLEGMASTCIAVLVMDHQLYLANLGDSRAYLLRKGKLVQLNYDHTWLEDSIGIELGAKSGITRNHPLAHVLSRFLGSPQPPEVDLRIRFPIYPARMKSKIRDYLLKAVTGCCFAVTV